MAKAKLTRPIGGAVEVPKEVLVDRPEMETISEGVVVERVEGADVVEGGTEQSAQAREDEAEGGVAETGQIARPISTPVAKDPLAKKIEGILEEDLEDVYKNMPPEKQAEFRKEGEEVASVIRTMIETAKFSVRKVLKLIRNWLRIIPGVNKFFLEQEVKIKTDKISAAVEEEIKNRTDQT